MMPPSRILNLRAVVDAEIVPEPTGPDASALGIGGTSELGPDISALGSSGGISEPGPDASVEEKNEFVASLAEDDEVWSP